MSTREPGARRRLHGGARDRERVGEPPPSVEIGSVTRRPRARSSACRRRPEARPHRRLRPGRLALRCVSTALGPCRAPGVNRRADRHEGTGLPPHSVHVDGAASRPRKLCVMALRPSFTLTLAALVTSCGGNPSSPAMASEARCATGAAPGGASVPLRQQHATARSMIADRIARQRLAVLHVDTGPACVPHVEVLRCTRHVVWRTEPLRAPGMAYPPWTAWAEPPWERYDRRRTPEVSFAQYMNSSQPSFIQEVPRVPFLDPYREEELPPIDASELAGPDCARATHYVRVSHGGAYRTLSTADHRVLDGSTCQPPASCADPIDLELEPVGRRGCPGLSTRTPNGCIALRRPVRFASAAPRPRAGDLDAPGPTARPEPCIPPAAGQPTAELAPSPSRPSRIAARRSRPPNSCSLRLRGPSKEPTLRGVGGDEQVVQVSSCGARHARRTSRTARARCTLVT